MGYTIKIGEAIVDVDYDFDYVTVDVRDEKHDNAPAYGEPTDFTNQRWPSYSGWNEFCKDTGLYDLFYDDDKGLIRPHPGEKPLKQEHLDMINEAVECRQKENGGKPAQTWDPKISITEDSRINDGDSQLSRLLWLQYWVKWALENCKQPINKNT